METIAFICALALLFKGVVTDVSVSLMEGDSVTLHANTEIQKDDVIDWMFGDEQDLLARINREANTLTINDDVLKGRFRGRLKMNNDTGDLTITVITTNHTGLYQLEISSETLIKKRFSVYVSVDTDKVKTEMVEDSVVLLNNVIKKPGDEKMVWRIRHNNSPVAEIIRNGKETNDEVHDERFRDRLKVDDQTGDLNITNITPDDFGSYEVNITVGNNYTIHRSFNVNVNGVDPQKDQLGSNKDEDQSSGLSSGVIAGVCVFVLVFAVALLGAVFLYRRLRRTTGHTSVSRDIPLEDLQLQQE